MQRGPALEHLRGVCAPAHASIEGVARGTGFLRSRESYARYLEATWGFYVVYEPRLEAALTAALADVRVRRKLALVEADLNELGRGPRELGTLPRVNAPAPWTTARAFGAAYVIEGSSLGGRYIQRQVLEAKICPASALSFFNGYGANTGAMWREFVEALERFAVAGELLEVSEGALQTFAQLEAWLRARFPEVALALVSAPAPASAPASARDDFAQRSSVAPNG